MDFIKNSILKRLLVLFLTFGGLMGYVVERAMQGVERIASLASESAMGAQRLKGASAEVIRMASQLHDSIGKFKV